MATVDLKTLFNDKSLPILNPVPNKAALDAIVTTDLLPGASVFQFDEAIFYRWDGADFLPFQFQQSVRNNYSDPLDPTSADNMSLNFTSGSIWINSVSKEVFICITSNMNTAEWKSLGSSQNKNYLRKTFADNNYQTQSMDSITWDATGGNITYFLPTNPVAGYFVECFKSDESNNIVTPIVEEGITIIGDAALHITGDSAVFEFDGVIWKVI